jgi:hypothetical protein
MDKLAIIKGTLDPNSPLSAIAGDRLAISTIFKKLDDMYKAYIQHTLYAYQIINFHYTLTFPPTQYLNINMMPFKLFENLSLPTECKPYLNFINLARKFIPYNPDHIAYLTIHESDVAMNETQRRPGLHVESPVLKVSGNIDLFDYRDVHHCHVRWGMGGYVSNIPVDGIYMASSVSNTTRVWPFIIDKHEEIADSHGGIECLRPYLGDGYTLKAGELCWFTDRTPHESLPLPENTHRQFFRLVVGKIDIWYTQHSTPNPLGVEVPDDVQIIHTNKFI